MKKTKAQLMRRIHYKRRYHAAIADYDFYYMLQQGKCACCGRTDNPNKQHFDMDHDHYTGQLRGLLCNPCNRLVGLAEHLQLKSKKSIEKVEKYLTGRVLFDKL